MASASVPAVEHSVQTSTAEIFVPVDPLVDRVLQLLADYESALLCERCQAMLRLKNARIASLEGGTRG